MQKFLTLAILTLLACSCTPSPPPRNAELPPIEAPPVPQGFKADWNGVKGVPHVEYTDMLVQALDELGADLLAYTPKDFHSWCGNAAKKKEFYVMLFSSLARFESAFKPATSYTENFKDAKGVPVVSRGLLQISKESANGYGCNIKDDKELHDPRTNLRCGVRIAARWIPRDGVIQGKETAGWRGMARYWSPFRKDDRIAAMKAKTKEACK